MTATHLFAGAALTLAMSSACAQGLFGLLGGGSRAQSASSGDVVAQADAFAARYDAWLRPHAAALYRSGEWGAVLNLQRLGLAAMQTDRPQLAARAFDEAILRVEAIYANDANAAKARSLFNAEKVKDFKGEPYERAMLFYYRGLLYAHEGDYQNARAAFLAADRHDTLSSAEDAAFVGSFGLMKYLASWASQCDGDGVRAAHLIQEASAADPKVAALPSPAPAALVLVDAGAAPEKWGDGQHKEILRFRPGGGIEPTVKMRMAGLELPLLLAGDVTYQATTRGRREVDGILAGKARFKDNAGAVGDVALGAGMQVALMGSSSGDRGAMNAGFAGMLIGIVAKGVEAATTPAADVRAWDSLPAKVWLGAGRGRSPEATTFAIGGAERRPMLKAAHGACAVAWLHAGTPASADTDPTVMEADRAERNRTFRLMLADALSVSR